ncbi:Sugar-specific transcriptional regulator TrmB [Treponema bryantii]|uniref:Sugar-specific transcriptional regulator TrmB n=1 Tax=Treponema bryantii TaxID=163 RepID=A0A1I3I0M5_9SPIR|nr:helix-turn-helix domain-containing protein [Treponema bryantii]SFI41442.1 Sugar-specific transcriptional regulator TrmB [Treponema bryantii]
MAETKIIDILTEFSLTRQEASIYAALLNHGDMTGYEVAKDTGFSRSNVYAALNALVEKGAAYLVQGESTKYRPVEIKNFTSNKIAELKKSAEYLEKHGPQKVIESEGYITIVGAKNIRNKMREMLSKTELRLYLMAPAQIVKDFEEDLKRLVSEGKKIVLLTQDYSIKGAKVYNTKVDEGQIRFITDSAYVLTGELTDDEHNTCLYSGQKNLVEVMKEALKDKITLLA